MIEIVIKTLEYYMAHLKEPKLSELSVQDVSSFEKAWSVFVTLYKNGEIRGSSWNIKEIEANLAGELIKNTFSVLSWDHRFPPVKMDEVKNLKIRIDLIKERRILKDGEIKSIDPVKNGVIFIKKDYDKAAVILPNISAKLMKWEDFLEVMKQKLWESSIDQRDYIIYAITTETLTNF